MDACAGRFGVARDVRKLVEAAGIRFFETPMGKSLLDEHHPLYGGCYAGANSLPAVQKEVTHSLCRRISGRELASAYRHSMVLTWPTVFIRK